MLWAKDRDEIKTQVRDLEAMHQIVMGLKTLSVVRADKELNGLLSAIERNLLSKYVALRKVSLHDGIFNLAIQFNKIRKLAGI